MADDGILVIAAGKLQAVDLDRPAAMGLRLGRVVDGPERNPAAAAAKHKSSLSMPSTTAAACFWPRLPARR